MKIDLLEETGIFGTWVRVKEILLLVQNNQVWTFKFILGYGVF